MIRFETSGRRGVLSGEQAATRAGRADIDSASEGETVRLPDFARCYVLEG